MNINDTVVLLQDMPELGLAKGHKGVIVEIFDQPHAAYEVEFCDHEGRTITEVSLKGDQISLAE